MPAVILRFFLAAGILSMASVLAAAEAPAPAESAPAVFGIPFEAIDARWEGGFREWSLVTKGRLRGTVVPIRYEQRAFLGEEGWESAAEVRLPRMRIENFSALLENYPTLAGLGGSGTITLDASAAGAGDEARWEGRIELEDVSLSAEELGISIEELAGALEWLLSDGRLISGPRQQISFRTFNWDEVTAGPGVVEFQIGLPEEVRVNRARLEWAGGHLSAEDVSFNPVKPDVILKLGAEGIQLAELLRLVPDFEGDGEGIIDGEIRLRIRSEGVGLEPGHLALRPGMPARLRLPRRDWFTEGMSPDLPNYENLRMVERALEDMELTRFRLDFLSDEDPDVPLRVLIEGRPLAEDVPAPSVTLSLNVHGPIQELGSWMLSPNVRLGVQ